ncbi:MAG: sensor domain-containing diguanylate cyclase [Candidatus Omnitrophota bacterium]
MKRSKKKILRESAPKCAPAWSMNQDLCVAVLDNIYDGVYILNNNQEISYWNRSAEKLTGYKADEVMGKKCSDGLLMHLNHKGKKLCLSGLCPAAKVWDKGTACEEELFLRHKNGHRVYVSTRMAPIMDCEGKVSGAIEVFSDNTEAVHERARNERLKELAMLDPLTELGNRRYGQVTLRSRLHELKRYNWPFGILFIDVDHFKDVNDKYSHEIGDKVLKMVADTLKKSARPFDTFCRWGGEEFLGIIANVRDAELFLVADRFRRLVEESSITEGQEIIRVTVSMGASTAHAYDTDESVVKRADALMYHSKGAGMNRVSME